MEITNFRDPEIPFKKALKPMEITNHFVKKCGINKNTLGFHNVSERLARFVKNLLNPMGITNSREPGIPFKKALKPMEIINHVVKSMKLG